MKAKYIKPETQLLDIDLTEYLQNADGNLYSNATTLPDSSGRGKGNSDWEFEDDYDEGGGLW